MKLSAIIVDLDGTLCDVSHRIHFINGAKRDFKSFNDGLIKDGVNGFVKDIITSTPHKVIFLTGRPEEYRYQTIQWMMMHDFHDYRLLMRPAGDYRPAPDYKRDFYERYIKDQYDVQFALDDDKRVAEMWKSTGVPVMLVL